MSDDGEGEKGGANRFMRDASESEESEDEEKVTVVKSAKDKRLEELENTVHLIENAEKINDWAVISAGESFLSSDGCMDGCMMDDANGDEQSSTS